MTLEPERLSGPLPLLGGRLIGGKWCSPETHAAMHAGLQSAAAKGYPNIACELDSCGELSGSIAGFDTRVIEAQLAAVAELDARAEAESEAWSFQPRRGHLYPEPPASWAQMTFGTFDDREPKNAQNADFLSFWSEEPGGVIVLQGVNGTGKTHLLAATVQCMRARNLDVSAWIWDEWLDTLRDAFGNNRREDVRAFEARMLTCGVLVIDELRGEDGQTGQNILAMFEKIVNQRVGEGRPMLLATNASIEELQRWSMRAASRLQTVGVAQWLVMIGEDRRIHP